MDIHSLPELLSSIGTSLKMLTPGCDDRWEDISLNLSYGMTMYASHVGSSLCILLRLFIAVFIQAEAAMRNDDSREDAAP